MTGHWRDPAELAHDLNNLLTAVIGTADAILARPGLDPDTRADVEAIREGARRGGGLGHGSDWAGIEPLMVNAAIRQTARLLTRRLGLGIALILDLAPVDWPVRMDASHLDRILLNLTANARHAMPAGGTVTLRTRRRAVIDMETHVPDRVPPGDYVTISIADTGPGIPATLLLAAFEPGFTTRRGDGGSGLGLPSVLGIVREAKGYVSVESWAGRGTRFEIYLPVFLEPAMSDRSADAGNGASLGTVLIVDDDPLVLGVTVQALRRAGWDAMPADSAEAALAVLDRTDQGCDLMISDISMPGVDGLALTRRVRIRRPHMPVILTSGYDLAPPDDAGVTFLVKPYGQSRLLDAAVEAVNQAKWRARMVDPHDERGSRSRAAAQEDRARRGAGRGA